MTIPKEIILYHGSVKAITEPVYGFGNRNNDYGLGFYCTENEELAKEWACTESQDGFANEFSLDLSGLGILDLTSSDYHILNWLAILLDNRNVSCLAGLQEKTKNYILSNFLPDYKNYDIIKGYRADDSYFSFARAFLGGTISLSQLSQAMTLGRLGEQIVLKSPKSFEALTFRLATPASAIVWYDRRMRRDATARKEFHHIRNEVEGEYYAVDILRQNWKNDDERLR